MSGWNPKRPFKIDGILESRPGTLVGRKHASGIQEPFGVRMVGTLTEEIGRLAKDGKLLLPAEEDTQIVARLLQAIEEEFARLYESLKLQSKQSALDDETEDWDED